MTAPTRTRIFKFGVFEVNPEAGELRKSGMRLKLAGQPFQVLRLLLEHPQEIVSREDMRRRIWPQDTYVDYDLGLRRAITRLREVLGDSAESPRFIETIPRQGYRFIAPLNSNGDLAAAAGLPTELASLKPSRTRHGMQIAIVVVLGLVAGLAALVGVRVLKFIRREPSGSAAPQIRSLAVLPLQNLSNDPTQEYLTEGLTDALITELAQNHSLKVISRTSSTRYKETKKSLPDIARELGVDGIIEGTVQRSGDRALITAQLVLGPSDKHLWANSYERSMNDIFGLERDVTHDIAREVNVYVKAPKQMLSPVEPRPANSQAFEAYLQGKYHMHKFSRGSGDDELKLASDNFERAIGADPNFAPAYVGLSECRWATMRSSTEDVGAARTSAERAVDLDPGLSEAWDLLGSIRQDDWEWVAAEESFRRAIQLNPSNARAHDDLGDLLDATGRMDEGWKEAQIAQQLDPYQSHLVYPLYKRHQYDQAIELALTLLGNDPNDGYLHSQLFEIYSAKGSYKEAVEQLVQAVTLFGSPERAPKLRHAYASWGYKGAMREYAKELEDLHKSNQLFIPVNLASAYAAIGDKDRAFYWLEIGYQRRRYSNAGLPISEIRVYLGLDPLRSDPRFKDLLRRVGLPQ